MYGMAISLSRNEQMILEAIWKAGHPLTRGQILEAVDGQSDWNPASVHLILNSMVKKGAVTVEDNITHYGRTYRAKITRSDYIAQHAQSICTGLTKQDRLLEVASALITQRGVTAETLDELITMVSKRRAELTK